MGRSRAGLPIWGLDQLHEAIEAFSKVQLENAKPSVWRKREVSSSRLKNTGAASEMRHET